MMLGIKRVVDTGVWTDPKYDEFSPEDRYFLQYLLTNPFTTQLGIYKISIRNASFQMGWSEESFKALLNRFEHEYGIIYYSARTKEIAIKNYLRHSIVKGGAPVRDCLIKEINAVKNKDLVAKVFSYIKNRDGLNETVKNLIAEYEEKHGVLHYCNENNNEIENDNENDNENDVSYHDTLTNRSKQSKPAKHKYGEYKNVLLSDAEVEKLKAEYKDYEKRIENLSHYLESTGKKYKSHYATIRNWARKDAEAEQTGKQPYARQTEADKLNDFYQMASEWAEEGE